MEKRIKKLAASYPERRSALLPSLDLVQRERAGTLCREDVRTVARILGLHPGAAWGAATFYSMLSTRPMGKYRLQVDTNIPAMLAGSGEILRCLEEKLGIGTGETTPDGIFTLEEVEDLGAADICPVVRVNDTYFGNLTVGRTLDLIESLASGETPEPDCRTHFATSCRILLKNRHLPESASLAVYTGRGGYRALGKARSMDPEDLVALVEESGLRGRGGAGYPTGRKWRSLPRDGRPVYLVCNADEGEPGAFKDRQIMEHDPHLLVEGIAVAACSVGASRAFVYIRGEYRSISRLIEKAIGEAEETGLLGDLVITVHRGAGSYICGEETALISSLEGRRGDPQPRPPYPVERGLYGCPTVVNNVETLAALPFIVSEGPEAFRKVSPVLFSVSGHVGRPGLYEYPLGTPLADLIETAGGLTGRLKAVFVGGLSSPVLRADEALSLNLDYDSCRKAGASLGSGAVIVMNESVSIRDVALRTSGFFAGESCGQCAPCREGTIAVRELLSQTVEGGDTRNHTETVLEICRGVKGTALCPLGVSFASSIQALLEKFPC